MNTKKMLQALILVVGLTGSVAAFISTPRLYASVASGSRVTCEGAFARTTIAKSRALNEVLEEARIMDAARAGSMIQAARAEHEKVKAEWISLNCATDTRSAVSRGGGVLLLAAFAFAGVTVIFKD